MRRLAAPLALLALAWTASIALSAPAALGAPCSLAPHHISLTRLPGRSALLRWRAPSASASRALTYRVLRAGRMVGQTRSSALVLRIVPGKPTRFTVEALTGGRGCSASARITPVFRAPGAVHRVRMLAIGPGRVRLSWRPARAGDAPVEGYRVVRDGRTVAQTRSRSYVLRLSAARAHTIEVLAVDTRGHAGSPGRRLRFGARPAAGPGPAAPSGLSVSDVSSAGATVWWVAAVPGRAPVVGYRVYRDGRSVGQTPQSSMRLVRLSSLRTYLITVAAVDSAGREGARTAPLRLSTGHTPPHGPALLSAVRVSDTSATLSWQAGAASTGTLVGYLLFENGQPLGVVHGQLDTVALASQRSYTFTVRALDSSGYLSTAAPSISVTTTHTPPSKPGGLSAGLITSTSATVSWSPSTAVSGQIVGYRVFRNQIPVGQTSERALALSSLAPSTEYSVTVAAVDSLGAVSEASAPLALRTAEPPPSTGDVQAALLASTDQSFYDLEANYTKVGVVYPTYFECGSAGAVQGSDDALVTGWAQARKIAVMPRLNCQNVALEEQILNQAPVRERLISALAALCAEHGYAGLQMDFEGAPPAERGPFTAFITALAARLHAQGEKLSTIVTAKYWNVTTGRAAMYDDAALSVPSDYIFVLDWGLHWTTSAPGPIDEYGWFKRIAEYTATMPNLSKFVLGMPMYGIDWANGGGTANPGTPLEYAAITAIAGQYGVTPEWSSSSLDPHFAYTDGSGAHHEIWYTNAQSVAARVSLARALGMKAGLWHLGSEDQGIWAIPNLSNG